MLLYCYLLSTHNPFILLLIYPTLLSIPYLLTIIDAYYAPSISLILLSHYAIIPALTIHSNIHLSMESCNLIELLHQNISNPITTHMLSYPLTSPISIAILTSLTSSSIIYSNYILIFHTILAYFCSISNHAFLLVLLEYLYHYT